MTEDDDNSRRLRNELDAAIGPTPPTGDRMRALVSRYDSWRRRRALTAAGAGFAAVAAVIGVGVAIAVGPGRSGNPPTHEISVSPTAGPVSGSPSSPPSPSTSGSAIPAPSGSGTASATTAVGAPPTATAPAAPTSQGTVVDEAGRPLAGIYVYGSFFKAVTRTDRNGHFVAPTVDGQQMSCLLFTSEPLTQDGTPPSGDFAWQEWQARSDTCLGAIGDIRIVMHPGFEVFGTVRDVKGNPVAGVTVYSTFGRDGRMIFSTNQGGVGFATTTDSAGRYHFYGEQPGLTTLTVRQAFGLASSDSGIPYQATAGSGQPVDLTDYGPGCDNGWPDPGCPNASPSETDSAPPPSTPPAPASAPASAPSP